MKKALDNQSFIDYLKLGKISYEDQDIENIKKAFNMTEEQIISEPHEYNKFKTTKEYAVLMQIPTINTFRQNLKLVGISKESLIDSIVENFDIWISTSII